MNVWICCLYHVNVNVVTLKLLYVLLRFQANTEHEMKDNLNREFRVQTEYPLDDHGYDPESTKLPQHKTTLETFNNKFKYKVSTLYNIFGNEL